MVASWGGIASLTMHQSLCNRSQNHLWTPEVSIILSSRRRYRKPKEESREFQTGMGKIYQIAINLNTHWWKIFFLLTHSALHLAQSALTWANSSGEMSGVPERNGASCNWICAIYVHLESDSWRRGYAMSVTASLVDWSCTLISSSVRVLFNSSSSVIIVRVSKRRVSIKPCIRTAWSRPYLVSSMFVGVVDRLVFHFQVGNFVGRKAFKVRLISNKESCFSYFGASESAKAYAWYRTVELLRQFTLLSEGDENFLSSSLWNSVLEVSRHIDRSKRTIHLGQKRVK